MRRVLVIAYYFPPSGGAGVQRVLKFVKYLPSHGWLPHVLTVRNGSFFAEDASLAGEIPATTGISRAFSLEPERLGWLRRRRRKVATGVGMPRGGKDKWLRWARRQLFPDAQVGWLPFATALGLKLLRTHRFDAIFSTCSPMTCHLVAASLARLSGLPWIADFRDPWAADPMNQLGHKWAQRRLEGYVVRQATHVTTVTPPMTEALRRYVLDPSRVSTLTNGFDPADIPAYQPPPPMSPWQFTFVGTLYGPAVLRPFLQALARLRREAAAPPVRATFVGQMDMACAASFTRDTQELGLAEVCERLPYVPHHEAVAHMQRAHVLLLPLYEGEGLRLVLPGKLFEYLAVGRPILAMSAGGAAPDLICEAHAGIVTPLHDADAVYAALQRLRQPSVAFHADPTVLARYSRPVLTAALAARLNHAIS